MIALRRFAREDLSVALAPWIASRAIVLLALAAARYIFAEIGAAPRPPALSQGLFAWDAAFYRDIAAGGYNAVAHSGLRFFAGLPLMARFLGAPIGQVGPVLIIIVNLASLLYAGLLNRLVIEETGDSALARRAIWLGLLAPPALVFVFGYAEALLALCAVLVFLNARNARWGWVIVAGFLAGIMRPTGFLLSLPVAIFVWQSLRGERLQGDTTKKTSLALGALGTASPVLGICSYLAWSKIAGYGLWEPLQIQSSTNLRGGFVWPWTSLNGAINSLSSGDRLGSGLHVVWAFVAVICVIASALKLSAAYTLWAAASIAVALCAPNLDSFERYALVTFPVIIGAGVLTSRPKDLFRGVIAVSSAGLFGSSILVFFGRLVP
ncbi:MAG: hypothetical protein F2894_05385 [Actinobacteria bacterium]|uniref:Unannotated protein n=1 Tax=freshwater metagenome TaxID=449393 RepID=A0A6J7QRM2_9ZZZZ|nr:hypothetical protein [Actinomycetota bacterium]